jgi:hypothetical protein
MIQTRQVIANLGLPSAQIIHAKYAQESASGDAAIPTTRNLYGMAEKTEKAICNGSAELRAIAARLLKKRLSALRHIKPKSEWPVLSERSQVASVAGVSSTARLFGAVRD